MAWDNVLGLASSAVSSVVPGGGIVASALGGVVSSITGATTSTAATEDARAREAGNLRLDIYSLAEVFRAGSFLGRSMSSWAGAAPQSQDARQFFRVTAAAVGAIDSGYRSRGDAGNRAAMDAAERWADAIDATTGLGIGSTVRAQNPRAFIDRVVTVRRPGDAAPVIPTTTADAVPASSWSIGGSVSIGSGRPPSGMMVGVVALVAVLVVVYLLRSR